MTSSPKCDNDLCEKNDDSISSCYCRTSNCLRNCPIYNRLNPLSEFYKILVPDGINFTINYECAVNIPVDVLRNVCSSEHFAIAKDLGIQCAKHDSEIPDRCDNYDCPKHDGDNCNMFDSQDFDYCKRYSERWNPSIYKILVPAGIHFTVNYNCFKNISLPRLARFMKDRSTTNGTAYDMGIRCTKEAGDINNG